MYLTTNKIAAMLRQKGYKLTPQRKTLLHVISRSQNHLTPSDIYQRVRKCHPGIGLVTVYRTLEILTGIGLICEVHTGGNRRSYLLRRPSGHHHHLICSDCGRVVDFTDCDLSGLEQRLSQETAFTIDGHLLEFSGRCQNCKITAGADV